MKRRPSTGSLAAVAAGVFIATACSGSDSNGDSAGSGGSSAESGGAKSASGGATSTGSVSSAGSSSSEGGSNAVTGGATSTGGAGSDPDASTGGASSGGAVSNGGSSAGGGMPSGGTASTSVTLKWSTPAANTTVSGTTDFVLTGSAFINVELFQGTTMLVRCAVTGDHRTATCSYDTKQLPDGAVTLGAHGWNSPSGMNFTSDADAGPRAFTVSNGASGTGGTSGTGGASGMGGTGGGATSFWPSGTDGISRTFADSFGAWRGRPSTSAWINVHWVSWDWLTAPGFNATLDGTNPTKLWDLYADYKGVVVLSASMAGPDSSTNYDRNMRDCANGDYDAYWQTFAQNAANVGRNGDNTVVSLAHEFNGTWFKWNPGNVGVGVWTGCWKHVYTAIHSKSSLKVAWVLSASSNTKKGGDYSVDTAWDAYPGDAYVDVVAINRYDFKSLSPSTTVNWKDTCSNTQDICYVANYARQHGKLLGVPEWSMDRGQYGYGDLPSFVQLMYGFFKDNADILAFEDNFNNDGSGDWNYYPESAVNMNSAEKYKSLWKQ